MNIYKKIKAVSKNYFRIDRWILIERDLSEKIVKIEPKILVQLNCHSIDTTLEFIRQTFYDNDLDAEELKELKLAKRYKHSYPNISYNKKVIAFRKMGSERVFVRNLRKERELPPDTFFTYAGYTDPAYRGKGIYPYLTTCNLKIARDNGYKFARAQVNVNNRAVIRALSKCGYYEIARFWHIRFLWWDFAALDMGRVKTRKRTPLM